ncbi:MAG TPA: hypothetical protein VFI46_18780, partial [Jiangellaceae bacterium]|nr:hypothetical protein [Jiangellaceae bacterium]
RSVGVYGMSGNRADHTATPPQLVLGFGNLTERAIQTGIATIADLLQGPATGKQAGAKGAVASSPLSGARLLKPWLAAPGRSEARGDDQ